MSQYCVIIIIRAMDQEYQQCLSVGIGNTQTYWGLECGWLLKIAMLNHSYEYLPN